MYQTILFSWSNATETWQEKKKVVWTDLTVDETRWPFGFGHRLPKVGQNRTRRKRNVGVKVYEVIVLLLPQQILYSACYITAKQKYNLQVWHLNYMSFSYIDTKKKLCSSLAIFELMFLRNAGCILMIILKTSSINYWTN